MTLTNFLCFGCGSLTMCAIFLLISWRQGGIDQRVVRHVRKNAYLKGWQDGKNNTLGASK